MIDTNYLAQQKKNAVTGGTSTRPSINSLYDNQFAAQQSQMQEALAQAIASQQKSITDAAPDYQEMRNEAYTTQAMLERARKENMANMGLSGAGGTSQTYQQRNDISLRNILGSTNRQQQDYTDNVNLAIQNLNTQYNADEASLLATTEAARTKDLLAQEETEINRLYDMYLNRAITAAQFTKMTGISVQKLSSGSSSGGGLKIGRAHV